MTSSKIGSWPNKTGNYVIQQHIEATCWYNARQHWFPVINSVVVPWFVFPVFLFPLRTLDAETKNDGKLQLNHAKNYCPSSVYHPCDQANRFVLQPDCHQYHQGLTLVTTSDSMVWWEPSATEFQRSFVFLFPRRRSTDVWKWYKPWNHATLRAKN